MVFWFCVLLASNCSVNFSIVPITLVTLVLRLRVSIRRSLLPVRAISIALAGMMQIPSHFFTSSIRVSGCDKFLFLDSNRVVTGITIVPRQRDEGSKSSTEKVIRRTRSKYKWANLDRSRFGWESSKQR